MTEKLLTLEEIDLINEQAKLIDVEYPENIEPIYFGNELTSILKITRKNKLIFIKGNLYTGFDHIHARHNFFSDEFFFIDEKADKPTRFDLHAIPITDYPLIADNIFCEKNRSEKNKKPEMFDVFQGYYNSEEKINGEFRLILYKGTKIVHSLFPIDNKKKKKSKTKYARGKIKIARKTNSSIYKIAIPYFSHERKLKFLIIIYNVPEENKSEIVIQSHDNFEEPLNIYKIIETTYESFPSNAHEEVTWQNRDLSDIESYFDKIEKL